MSDTITSELGWVTASGAPREIGRALGVAGRDAVQRVLLTTDYWKDVTDPRHAMAVERMMSNLKSLFPSVWDELCGLAEGLELPLQQVAAWNCRGDITTNVPDGCTTVQIPGDPHIVAHNEDGLPEFHGHAFLARITPETGPSFMSFCYPGSLPGHTFAVNAAGITQAVNNLRLRNVVPILPRMGLGRALLACDSLQDALDLLSEHNECGGFHMTLAQAGDPRVMSVEFGGGTCSAMPVTSPNLHANHALHMARVADDQLVTESSRDRQARGIWLLAEDVTDPLLILRDTGGTGLPLHRTQPDDPDNENTLATCVFHISSSGVEWNVYDQTSEKPAFTGCESLNH